MTSATTYSNFWPSAFATPLTWQVDKSAQHRAYWRQTMSCHKHSTRLQTTKVGFTGASFKKEETGLPGPLILASRQYTCRKMHWHQSRGVFGCKGITSWIADLRFASVLASRVTCAPLLANSMATSLPILRKPRHKSETSASAVELHRPQWLGGCSSELCLPVFQIPGLFPPSIRLTPVSRR